MGLFHHCSSLPIATNSVARGEVLVMGAMIMPPMFRGRGMGFGGFSGTPKTTSCFEDKRVFTQMIISKRSAEVDRCPLCCARTKHGVIVHLKLDHRRTEIETHEIMERNAEGTLGWDPEIKKKKAALRNWRIGN
jgi:hypothetical protein